MMRQACKVALLMGAALAAHAQPAEEGATAEALQGWETTARTSTRTGGQGRRRPPKPGRSGGRPAQPAPVAATPEARALLLLEVQALAGVTGALVALVPTMPLLGCPLLVPCAPGLFPLAALWGAAGFGAAQALWAGRGAGLDQAPEVVPLNPTHKRRWLLAAHGLSLAAALVLSAAVGLPAVGVVAVALGVATLFSHSAVLLGGYGPVIFPAWEIPRTARFEALPWVVLLELGVGGAAALVLMASIQWTLLVLQSVLVPLGVLGWLEGQP